MLDSLFDQPPWRFWPNGLAKRDAMFKGSVWIEHPARQRNNCKCERCSWRRLTELHHLCTADCPSLRQHLRRCEAALYNDAYYLLRPDQLKGYCGPCHRWLSTGEWLDIRTNRWIKIDPADPMFRPQKDMREPPLELYGTFYQLTPNERRMSSHQARDVIAQQYNALVARERLRTQKAKKSTEPIKG